MLTNPLDGGALKGGAGVSDEKEPNPLMGFETIVGATSVKTKGDSRDHQLVPKPEADDCCGHHGRVMGVVDNECHNCPYETDQGDSHAEDYAYVVCRPAVQASFNFGQESGEVL